MRRILPKSLIAFSIFLFTILALTLSGCSTANGAQSNDDQDGKLRVISTTSILADVVSQVGGDLIHLEVLLPLGADPHSFDPTPRDVAEIADAQVIFANGAGLEEFLQRLLANAQAIERVVYVSDEIHLLETESELHLEHTDERDGPGEAESEDSNAEHDGDPHVWMDPTFVMEWVRRIEQKLRRIDPDNASVYETNAARYLDELQSLDDWIFSQVATIPESNRQFVTDHRIFGYFAARYDFKQVGAIIPSFTSMAEPSAQDLAALEEIIDELDVKVVFVGNTINPSMAQRVSEDTGMQLIFLYTGSLSEAGGPADNYIDFMRFNVNAIVNGLN